MVKVGKGEERSVQRKKSHIKVNQKVSSTVKWNEMRQNEKKKKRITSEIITLPRKMQTEKKWTNHDTHTVTFNGIPNAAGEKICGDEKFSMWVCVLFFAPSPFNKFIHPLTHTCRSCPCWWVCALNEMKRFARLFQVVMAAVATTMNEHNYVEENAGNFLLLLLLFSSLFAGEKYSKAMLSWLVWRILYENIDDTLNKDEGKRNFLFIVVVVVVVSCFVGVMNGGWWKKILRTQPKWKK